MDKLDVILQEKIGWSPHPGQAEVIESYNKGTREIIICAGRRWGKSAVCGYLVAKTFIQLYRQVQAGTRDDIIKIWVVSPTYELSKKVFEYIVRFLRKVDPKIVKSLQNRPFPQIKLTESIWIQCKSADSPEGLMGESIDLLIVDEAASISKRVWFEHLGATMADRRGSALFISTPKGKNWFYDLWIRAKEKEGAFHFKSNENPYFPVDEWERFKKDWPTDLFQQEFQASFLEAAASVFRNVRSIVQPKCLSEPLAGHNYIIGLDLAKMRDFTVLTVIDKSSHKVVYFDRFQKISYPLQIERIENVARRYNGAKIIIDVNSMGGVVADELRARGCKVKDFKIVGTTSKDFEKRGSKERLIEKLNTGIANKNLSIPDWEIMVDELEAYSYKMTPSGNYKYGAPEGLHDDCVISLALSYWGIKSKTKERAIRASKSIPRGRKSFQYK